MFEFEATTYEILRYEDIKGDRPAKSVDQVDQRREEGVEEGPGLASPAGFV